MATDDGFKNASDAKHLEGHMEPHGEITSSWWSSGAQGEKKKLGWLWPSSHCLPVFTWEGSTCPNQKVRWLSPHRRDLLPEAAEAVWVLLSQLPIHGSIFAFSWDSIYAEYVMWCYAILYYKTLREGERARKDIGPHALGYKGGSSYGESPRAPALGFRWHLPVTKSFSWLNRTTQKYMAFLAIHEIDMWKQEIDLRSGLYKLKLV